MRLLLDTHVFLCVVAGAPPLKPAACRFIEAADEVFVSAASLWEVAIKARLGTIDADARERAGAIEASGFQHLAVTAAHAAGVAFLELHHQDPIDRLLVAQARTEPLRLLTADEQLARCGDLMLPLASVSTA